MTRKKRARGTGHGLALAAVAAALIATPDPAGAQEGEADLLGTVGAWTVGISVNGGEVSYALTRRDYRLPVFRLWCLPDGEWAAATMTDLRYGWFPSENLRQGSVWTRFDGGPESLQGAAVDDYGGVLRGFVVAVERRMWTSRTVSFRLEGDSATMTFDLAGLHDAHRLAYTVTGLCRPPGSDGSSTPVRR